MLFNKVAGYLTTKVFSKKLEFRIYELQLVYLAITKFTNYT